MFQKMLKRQPTNENNFEKYPVTFLGDRHTQVKGEITGDITLWQHQHNLETLSV